MYIPFESTAGFKAGFELDEDGCENDSWCDNFGFFLWYGLLGGWKKDKVTKVKRFDFQTNRIILLHIFTKL